MEIDELRRRYAAAQKSKDEAQKREADAALERMSPRDRQQCALQEIKLFEFFNTMEEIFGKELPLFVPANVNLAEGTRIPTVKWGALHQGIRSEELDTWMEKLETALWNNGCVQVRLGERSSNLCTLDVDHDSLVEPLLQANPILATTLQTYGSKGRTFWFYAEGDYPRKRKRIISEGHDDQGRLIGRDDTCPCGSKEKYKECCEQVIEFLTDNTLCTIYGTHYRTGQQYQIVHKVKPITFNLNDLLLPPGCAWEVKYENNGHGKKRATFTGGFRANGNGSVTHGRIDWAAYDAARAEDPEIVELLVSEYFEANKEEKTDGTHVWHCSNICGDPPHDRKKGSFEIDSIGRCTEWADDSHYSIMQAITSDEREERYTFRDAFTYLAGWGYNFFMTRSVTFPDEAHRPRTICYDEDFIRNGENYPAGVYRHFMVESTKEGVPDYPEDEKICSPIKAGGITHTKEVEEYSILLEFIPKGKNEWRKILLSRAALMATRSDEARTRLASVGVEFFSNDWKHVHEYLERLDPPNYLTQVKLTGWVNKEYQTFVLPHIMLGKTTDVYFDPGMESVEYGINGMLWDWQNKVAQLAVGNDWLLFGLSVGLVGPLLEPLNLMGGGYHLHGDSSMGKTTILRIAASVWGSILYLRTWKATANGLEIICVKRSGTLLVLDESDEATADTVYASLYMIANGRGKARMQKDVTERPSFNWRVCALSSGERTLETQITENGRGKYKVGQEMRMVPLNPTLGNKYGVFNDLHGQRNGAEFSQHVVNETAKFYGNAGIQFIENLIASGTTDLLPSLKDEQNALEKGLNPSPQESRVARSLAAVALAGELAIKFGIFPFKGGIIRTAVRSIYEGWLPPRIAGVHKNQEHNNIIIAIRDFIDRNGAGRFLHPIPPQMRLLMRPRPISDQAGYQEEHEGKIGYLFTPIGLKTAVEKVCDVKRAAKALYDQGALYETGSGGEIAKLRKIEGKPMKLYHVNYEAL
jgi:putative DNA primase/helicase